MSKTTVMQFMITLIILIGSVTAVVRADADLDVSPKKIGLNEKVTLTFTSVGVNKIDKIEVTYEPTGEKYVIDYIPDLELGDGEVYTEEFGTSISGWDPAADTGREGFYHVVVIGFEPPFRQVDQFNASKRFYVPEFAVASVVVTAIGFVILNTIRKFNKKSKHN